MKLNHAQRTHLINKFSTEAKAIAAKQKDPAGPLFEITMPCEVKVSIASWYSSTVTPGVSVTRPTQKALEKLITPAQKRALQQAVAAKQAYNNRHAKVESLIEDFKEQLLFADGGLDEANALIKAFLAKLG
jgi:hypothetical protein